MNRIILYTPNDFAYAWMLKEIPLFFQKQFDFNNINDILEILTVEVYLKKSELKNYYGETQYNSFLQQIKILTPSCHAFLQCIDDNKLNIIVKELSYKYKNFFWELFNNKKLYEKINSANFIHGINETKSLPIILKYSNIVKYYNTDIKYYMLEHTKSAELIIKKEIKDGDFILPSFTIEELESLFTAYIKSDNVNITFLELFLSLKYICDKNIPPTIKILAEQTKEKKESEFFNKNSYIESKLKIAFVNNEVEDYYEHISLENTIFLYNINYLTNNFETPTILNNFITFFNYIDIYNHINLLPYDFEAGIFEKTLTPKYEKYYYKNIYFEQKKNIMIIQLSLYYNLLKEKSIYLENIIYDYYTNFIKNEFNFPSFILPSITNNTSYYEKSCILCTIIESILIQFKLLVTHKDINSSLLQYNEEFTKPANITSFLENKYIYGIGDDFKRITYLLFSDQTLLGYTEKTQEKYSNFCKLLLHEKMGINDFEDFKHNDINYLLDKNIIKVNEDNMLAFVNYKEIIILNELYHYGYIFTYKNIITNHHSYNNLLEKGIITAKSTLLSTQEADYFNYFLNDYFKNGLAIRNNYLHGVAVGLSENKHYENFLQLLHIAILLTIKINTEFNYITNDLYGCFNKNELKPFIKPFHTA